MVVTGESRVCGDVLVVVNVVEFSLGGVSDGV